MNEAYNHNGVRSQESGVRSQESGVRSQLEYCSKFQPVWDTKEYRLKRAKYLLSQFIRKLLRSSLRLAKYPLRLAKRVIKSILRRIKSLFAEPNRNIIKTPAKDPSFKSDSELAQIINNLSGGLNFSTLPKPKPLNRDRFSEKLSRLREWLKNNNIDPENICVANSAVLECYGLREANDFDIIISGTSRTASQVYVNDDIFEILPSQWFKDVSNDQLVRDPACHFYFEGIKFVRLEYVYCHKNALKQGKGAKDFADLENIRDFMINNSIRAHKISNPDFKTQEEIMNIIKTLSDGLDFTRIQPNPRNKARFTEKLTLLKQYLRDNNIALQDICVANSAALEIYGLREADDFDVLVSSRLNDIFSREVTPLINGKVEKLHADWLKDFISDDQLIDDPACYFVYEGVKFVRLPIVYGYKKILQRDKDIADIAMIREYLARDENFSECSFPPEYNIFILWENAQYRKNEIISDIKQELEIIKICDIEWEKKYFPENLTRFYGVNLPKNSDKEKHVGDGIFTLIFCRDHSPCYQKRLTSKGIKNVNANMFDRKTLYRRWTGGGHKVHSSNDESEARHDLALLFGLSPEKLEALATSGNFPDKISRNTAGLNEWYNLDELFYTLNNSVKYVVLRNFEYLPDKFKTSEHGDIDLLVDDYDEAVRILSGKKVFTESYRVHYCARVAGELVYFDLRHVGDNYYCSEWEQDILKDRDYSSKGFYIPNQQNYKWSLLYHALIHKPAVSQEYTQKLAALFDFGRENYLFELRKFLDSHNYSITCPNDYSVYANEENSGIKRVIRPHK